ncbi:MAG: hypothetical protein ACFFC6_14360 [Promethearchaeota archaeon]
MSKKDTTSLTDGLIISIFEDHGPENIYNSSPLSEEEAFNLAIKSFAVLSSEVPQVGVINSYGPIPTPREPFLTIGLVLTLKAEDSADVRIAQFGRIVVFWVITRSRSVVNYTGVLKQLLQRTLRSYRIHTDIDLKEKEFLAKIDDKLQIIETGVESFYLSDKETFEPFLELALVPANAPILLVDKPNKQINVLLREKVTPSLKVSLLHKVKNYTGQLPKGSLYKTEIVSDEFTIQRMLSKIGITPQTEAGIQYRIRLTDELTFAEVDEYLDFHFTPKRQTLATLIIKSHKQKSPLNLGEASIQTGISEKLIEDFIISLITAGLLKTGKIENGVLYYKENNSK